MGGKNNGACMISLYEIHEAMWLLAWRATWAVAPDGILPPIVLALFVVESSTSVLVRS